MAPHVPVLLEEVLSVLDPRPDDTVIDGTVGGGGHAAALLARLGPNGRLIGIDRDPLAVAAAERRFEGDSRATFIHGTYAEMGSADCVLLDLGFSSAQLDAPEKGFSFDQDAPLRMTYDPDDEPVASILRRLSEKDLADIIFRFGGERMSRRIAKAIHDTGRAHPIMTTGALAKVVRDALPRSYERGRIDRATRTFQALRIYANRELEHLETFLDRITEILNPGGRVAIISFHSLEDKLVKTAFQQYAKQGAFSLITKKPITATDEERAENPRSRSAKLRAARRLP